MLHKPVTPTCVLCSCDFTRHGGRRFICADPQWLCRQSVHSQHTGKSFPQQGHSQKGICNTAAPSGGRNNSDAGDMMPCTHSGVPELYVRVVCSASQTPKSLPSKDTLTSAAELMGECANHSLSLLPCGDSHGKSNSNAGSFLPTARDVLVSICWGLL